MCGVLNNIVISLTILLNFSNVSSGHEKNYGLFNLTVSSFVTCKGPKHKDCATASAIMSDYKTIKYDIIVPQNVSPTKGKITAFTNGKEFLRLQMKRPCDHLFMKPLFQSLMNVSEDCIVAKGHYRFNVDLMKIAQTYYDGAFLFGNWTFKSIFYNDQCNFSCTVVKVEMSPRNKVEVNNH